MGAQWALLITRVTPRAAWCRCGTTQPGTRATCDGAEKKVVIFYENEFSEHSRYTLIIVTVNCGNVSIMMLGIMSHLRPDLLRGMIIDQLSELRPQYVVISYIHSLVSSVIGTHRQSEVLKMF